MNESDRRQHIISTAPHLTPDEVANRMFGRKARGFSETEVRSFLKRVSEELTAARERERELTSAMDALEEQLRAPRPLSEQELLEALGEETARLLRSAREAGDDIRRKADERAARITEDAITEAERLRAEAAESLTQRLAEADNRCAEQIALAEAEVAQARERALIEADAIIEGARVQGREMLEEAKSVRERVLGDLVRRRALLQSQIEELRTGREQLVEAYGTVKRTFLEATDALAQVESRAAVERASSPDLDIAAEIAAEIAALDPVSNAVSDETAALEVVDLVAVDPESSGDAESDVDSLFARLRAGSEAPAEAPQTAGTAATPAAPAVAVPPTSAPAPASTPVPSPPVSAGEWRGRRYDAVDPLLARLVKRAKRALQDDQNALLDAVRRHKGRPAAAQVLPDLDASLQTWSELLGEAVHRAYSAGVLAGGGHAGDAPFDLVREAAESVVMPLRERLTIAIDTGEERDTSGLVERIGARYREWKNQSLEPSLQETLSFVWSRGVYDAAPEGAILWWIPAEDGRCSDCDDNALEPTVKGKLFPTGQAFPPAHPGCTCLLAPADVLSVK
jgi:DivIVA domain-containing protein